MTAAAAFLGLAGLISWADWPAPAPLDPGAASDTGIDTSPQVATDGAGRWMVVWEARGALGGSLGTDSDLLFSVSANNGSGWSAPAALNSNAASDAGDDASAFVVSGGAGKWMVVWDSNDTLGGTLGDDFDILFSASTDNGVTWSAPAPVNTNAAVDQREDTAPTLACDGAGQWVAAWEACNSQSGAIATESDLLTARSTNLGTTWTPPAALNTNAATDTDWDYAPCVATDRAGVWVCVWQAEAPPIGSIDTFPDIVWSRSTDQGKTWTAPAGFSGVRHPSGRREEHPTVAADGAGRWAVVWTATTSDGTNWSDTDIAVSHSGDGGLNWAAPAWLNSNA
ncbi:MAG: sialidase family protein, partial [Candidatus Sumerlaeota bacterium]|nr:sialidase family protein [Candidatus Sumerlaeota bacterium]